MTQSELNTAVSEALGEDVNELNLAFSLVDPTQDDFDAEPDQFAPQVYDWDAPFAGTSQSFHQTI